MTDDRAFERLGFTGKVAFVTGAGRGIGRATAVILAERGASIAAVGRTRSDLLALQQQLGADRCSIHVADVGNVDDVAAAVAAAIGEHGGIDLVVNNAGTSAFEANIATVSDDDWDRTIATNLSSVRNVSRAAIPSLKARGGGVIVNVSSVHAFATADGVAPYAASKGAVVALTRAMALDLADFKIRVVCVLPGATDTPMLAEYAEKKGSSLEDLGFPPGASAIGHVMPPEDSAEVICFVCAPAAAGITGSSIAVDAGLLARL
jgi:NAD(P)-dependent dehydrogenase (short-subunit alcohol dehydrogenase family)